MEIGDAFAFIWSTAETALMASGSRAVEAFRRPGEQLADVLEARKPRG